VVERVSATEQWDAYELQTDIAGDTVMLLLQLMLL